MQSAWANRVSSARDSRLIEGTDRALRSLPTSQELGGALRGGEVQTASALSSMVAGQGSAGFTPEDFLTLLVTQLKYQDPLEPMNEREMVAQLCQLQSLAELQQIRVMIERHLSDSSVAKDV
jgi:hypothetical protein